VIKIDAREAFKSSVAKVIDLGDATLLPGFIELHAHLAFQHIPADTVLKHGITTIRDVGGLCTSLMAATVACVCSLPDRLLPRLAVIRFRIGAENIAIAVATEQQARKPCALLLMAAQS